MGISRIMLPGSRLGRPCCSGSRSVCASCTRGLCPEFAKKGCSACIDCSADALRNNIRRFGLNSGYGRPPDYGRRKPVTVAAPMGLAPPPSEANAYGFGGDNPIDPKALNNLVNFVQKRRDLGNRVEFPTSVTGLNSVTHQSVTPPNNGTDPKGVSGTGLRRRRLSPAPFKPASVTSASAGAGGSVSAGTNTGKRWAGPFMGGGRRSTNRRTHKKSRKLKRRHTRKNY